MHCFQLPRKEAAQKKFYAEDAALNFNLDEAEKAILPRAHSVANIAKVSYTIFSFFFLIQLWVIHIKKMLM